MSVEQNLEQILSARYGKDVRQSIHDAIYDINEVAKDAEYHASTAPTSAQAYANAALAAEQAAQQAKQDAEAAAEQAMSGTPTGYEQLVSDVYSLETEEDVVLASTPTFAGRVLLDKMYGMSIQNGTPTPSVPIAINSAKANFTNIGKNLITLLSGISQFGFTAEINQDGSVTINGSNENNKVLTLTSDIIFKTTKALKFTGCPSGGGTSSYRLQIYDVTSDTAPAYDSGSGATFTPNPNHKYRVRIYVTANYSMLNVTFKPMLTFADVTDQTFEKYQGQSTTTDLTLRAIEVTSSDDYNLVKDGKYYVADTLEKIDGGYQITRRVGNFIFNGTEPTWAVTSSGYARMDDSSFTSNIKLKNDNFGYGLCNRLEVIENVGTLPYGVITYCKRADMINIGIKIANNITTEAALKTWLSSNDVEAYYIMATSTTESISNADAKKLLSLKSYDEATYVAQTEDTEGVMVLKYGSTELSNMAVTGYVEGEKNEIDLTATTTLKSIRIYGDGSKTQATLLNELFTALNGLGKNVLVSKVVFRTSDGPSNIQMGSVYDHNLSYFNVFNVTVGANDTVHSNVYLNSSSSRAIQNTNGTSVNYSSQVLTSSQYVELDYYEM